MSADIISSFLNTPRPLVGLEYIVILINKENTRFKRFRCLSCRLNTPVMSVDHILKHIESVEHQLMYLVSKIRCGPFVRWFTFLIYCKQTLHFPTVAGELYRTRPPIKIRIKFVYAICDAIERTYGRKDPQFLKAYEFHRARCIDHAHFTESNGADFIHVLWRCRRNSKLNWIFRLLSSQLDDRLCLIFFVFSTWFGNECRCETSCSRLQPSYSDSSVNVEWVMNFGQILTDSRQKISKKVSFSPRLSWSQ